MMKDLRTEYNISSWPDLKINFWGITKCASTSIKYAMFQQSNKELKELTEFPLWVHGGEHVEYLTYDEALSNGHLNIAVVRDPIQRFISMYKDVMKRRTTRFKSIHEIYPISSIDDFINYLNEVPDVKRDVHFRTQSSFIYPGDRILPEAVFSIDYLSELEDLIGCDLKVLNKIDNEVILSTMQINKIKKIFNKDFKLLEHVKYYKKVKNND